MKKYDNELSCVDVLLIGLFKDYQHLHMGGHVYFLAMATDLARGYKNFVTDVSSNNPKSLRLYEKFGYRVDYLQEVYIKHFQQ